MMTGMVVEDHLRRHRGEQTLTPKMTAQHPQRHAQQQDGALEQCWTIAINVHREYAHLHLQDPIPQLAHVVKIESVSVIASLCNDRRETEKASETVLLVGGSTMASIMMMIVLELRAGTESPLKMMTAGDLGPRLVRSLAEQQKM